MLTPEQAAADRRAERALRDAEIARLRRGTARRRAAEALRSVATRLEPTAPAARRAPTTQRPPGPAATHAPARTGATTSALPELVRSGA